MSALTVDVSAGSHVARRSLAFFLMVISGAAALGYQIVWTQQCALWLGHESAAVLAVVAAFFGGSALGALTLGARIEASRRPAHWYVACEASIGLWSVALAALLPRTADELLQLIGPHPSSAWHWFVVFVATFVMLLPATAAMGATLPAMQRMLEAIGRDGKSIGLLYAGNTLGAVAGVLLAAFELVPALGLTRTAQVCALLNLLCAVAAPRLSAAISPSSARIHGVRMASVWFVLFGTGMLGIGYEVLAVRVLSQVAENTVYTFALLLAVYLLGTAVGAAVYQRRQSHRGVSSTASDGLLHALAAACLVGTLALAGAESIKQWALTAFGASFSAALAAEASIALAAFLLPTLVMGALFSHLCTQARGAGMSFARALGINTIGAAIAPLVFGVWLLPAVGSKTACLLLPAGYLALCAKRAWRSRAHWGLIAGVVLAALWFPSLAIVDVPAGGRILHYAEGAMATVSVVEDAAGVASLHINNRQQEGSSATLFADGRQALLPILLHPAPRRALFLGLGTGVTVSAAARDPSLQVDAVELLPEVITASAYFTRVEDLRAAGSQLRVTSADARRFIRTADARYEVIVADNFHPARSGSGALYTVEHFQAVQRRLTPDGVFCQWLPLHQLDLATLRIIVRAFRTAFPHSFALLATNSLETPVIGLVALNGSSKLDSPVLQARLQAAAPLNPQQFAIDDELALLGSLIAGPSALARFAGAAPLNTDDHPVVAYLAPRITYVPASKPSDRLLALLHEVSIAPDEVLLETDAPQLQARLAAYWLARDRYLAMGQHVRPSSDVRRMLAQVRAPLLSVLQISPDFRPAYDPLLRMAAGLAEVDITAARALLMDLQRVQPARVEAGELLRALEDRSNGW